MLTFLRRLGPPVLGFCKFKYYRDLAQELSLHVPKINEDLGFQQDDRVTLVGFKLRKQLQTHPTEQVPESQELSNRGQTEQVKSPDENPALQADPESKQNLSFSSVLSFAKSNELDVLLSSAEDKQVSLVRIRAEVYRKYYQQKLFKASSTAKKHKQIRLPESIQIHDLNNKANQVLAMVKKGDYLFKVYTENDSDKSRKAMEKFISLLGKEAPIQAKEHQIQPKSRKHPRGIKVERWAASLNFEQEASINYEQVNRKWKRKLIDDKLEAQNLKRSKDFRMDIDEIKKQPIDFQKMVLQNLRHMRDKTDQKYEYYQPIIQEIEDDSPSDSPGSEALRSRMQQMAQHAKASRLRSTPEDNIKRIQDNFEKQQESQSEELSEDELEDQDMTTYRSLEGVQNIPRPSPERMKELRQGGMRTVEDILEQIEKIQSNKVYLDSFESFKVKKLEEELKTALRSAGYQSKL